MRRRPWGLGFAIVWLGHSLLAACAPAPAASADSARTPPPMFDPMRATTPTESYQLPNGLRVVLNQDMRVPLVAVRVAYRVGWGSDPKEHPGLAHLVEHLMFHGGQSLRGTRYFEEIARAGGGNVGASTEADFTSYWQQVPANEFALPLWLESHRMESGLDTLADADLTREVHILARERSEHVDNTAYARALDFATAQFFPSGHPYHINGVTSEALDGVSLADARQFHREFYGPNNAVLVLTGAFDPSVARSAIEHYFNQLKPRELPARHALPANAAAAARSLHVAASVLHPRVLVSWSTPALFAAGDADLDVIAHHLNQHLLQSDRARVLALQSFADQRSRPLGSVFTVFADLRRPQDGAAFVELVQKELAEFAQSGIDASEVTAGIYAWLFDLCIRHDSLLGRSQQLASSVALLGDPAYLERESSRYRGVTGATIQRAVQSYLRTDQAIVTSVEPTSAAPIAGKLVAE